MNCDSSFAPFVGPSEPKEAFGIRLDGAVIGTAFHYVCGNQSGFSPPAQFSISVGKRAFFPNVFEFEFGIAVRLLAMSLQLRSRLYDFLPPGAHTHDKSSSGSGIPVENRKACEVGVSSKSK